MRKSILVASFVLVYVLHSNPAKSQALVDLSCAPPGSSVPVSCRGPGLGNAGYPPGATPWFQAATGTTAGTTATQAGVAGQFTYVCGFFASPGSATAAIVETLTTTGLQANFSANIGAPATAAGATGIPLAAPQLGPCLRSNAANQTVTMVWSALGAGGAGQTINMWGYTQ